MKLFLLDKLEYQYVSNQRIIDTLESNNMKHGEAHRLISHVLRAQEIWNARILGRGYEGSPWEEYLDEELGAVNASALEESRTILNELDLESTVSYQNSKGEAYSNTVSEIIYHQVNHGTYHRGQLMKLFAQEGLPTFSTDYIYFKRKR